MISIYDPYSNKINHILMFDEKFKKNYSQDSTYEELLPQVIFSS